MVETGFLRELIVTHRPVMIRLTEGRDIAAILLGQDGETVLVQRHKAEDRALIYKRSISVITPSEEEDKPNAGHTNEQPAAAHQPAGHEPGRGGGASHGHPVPRH